MHLTIDMAVPSGITVLAAVTYVHLGPLLYPACTLVVPCGIGLVLPVVIGPYGYG